MFFSVEIGTSLAGVCIRRMRMAIVMAMNNADDEYADDDGDDWGGDGGGSGGGGGGSDEDNVAQNNFHLNIVNAFLLPLLHQRCCSGVTRQRR